MMDLLNCHLLSFAVELDSLSIPNCAEFGRYKKMNFNKDEKSSSAQN